MLEYFGCNKTPLALTCQTESCDFIYTVAMCLCISLCNLLYPHNSISYFSFFFFFFIKCMLMLMNASFLKTMWEPLFLPRFAFSFCFLLVVNFPEVLLHSMNDKDSSSFSDTTGSCGVSLQANGIFYLCPFLA